MAGKHGQQIPSGLNVVVLRALRVDCHRAPAFTGTYPVRFGRMEAATVTAGGVAGSDPGYRLAAAGRENAEDERLDLLEQIFDPGSRHRRDLIQPGWRCLEIGAGRGSMAAWLAERVGPAGQVVATDIDCRYLARLDLPNLEVVRHNIIEDPLDVLGPGSFDLVCARLVLFWLAGKQEAAIRTAMMLNTRRPSIWVTTSKPAMSGSRTSSGTTSGERSLATRTPDSRRALRRRPRSRRQQATPGLGRGTPGDRRR